MSEGIKPYASDALIFNSCVLFFNVSLLLDDDDEDDDFEDEEEDRTLNVCSVFFS